MAEKRTCKETTKAGKPCKATPLKDGDYCLVHAQDKGEIPRVFGGRQPGAGRPRLPRVIDVIRESIEVRAAEVVDGLWEAAYAERAVVVGNGPTAYMEMVPDWPTRIVARRELMDRAYGRPTQISEVTVITQDMLDAEISKLLEALAANDSDSSGRESGVARALQGAESTA